jgi:hypothetical protein
MDYEHELRALCEEHPGCEKDVATAMLKRARDVDLACPPWVLKAGDPTRKGQFELCQEAIRKVLRKQQQAAILEPSKAGTRNSISQHHRKPHPAQQQILYKCVGGQFTERVIG